MSIQSRCSHHLHTHSSLPCQFSVFHLLQNSRNIHSTDSDHYSYHSVYKYLPCTVRVANRREDSTAKARNTYVQYYTHTQIAWHAVYLPYILTAYCAFTLVAIIISKPGADNMYIIHANNWWFTLYYVSLNPEFEATF